MTFNKPVVFSGFLHQFKNREDIAEILLTVTLNTIILTSNTENLYKMIKGWDKLGHWKWVRDDIFCLLLFRNPQKMSFTSWHFQNVSPRIVQDHAFGSMSRQVRRWHYTFVCRKNWCSVLNYKAYVYELTN
jgi:hypothetical protein